MSVQIRPATVDDIPWLMLELQKFSAFFGTRLQLFDAETAPDILRGFIENHYFTIAQDDADGPVGFIAGLLLPHPFNPKIVQLTETFWWVKEEHRSGRAGLKLFEEFHEFGKLNADWIAFTLETHSPVKDHFMRKHGFKPNERCFLYEVS